MPARGAVLALDSRSSGRLEELEYLRGVGVQWSNQMNVVGAGTPHAHNQISRKIQLGWSITVMLEVPRAGP